MKLLFALLIFSFTHQQKDSIPTNIAHKDTMVTQFFQRDSGWIAGDGALSISLSNQKILWLFGDSHINDYNPKTKKIPCLFQVRNGALLQDKDDWRPQDAQTLIGKSKKVKSLFKNTPDNHYWFWPENGFQLGDTIFIYLSALEKTAEGGAWSWKNSGQDQWAKMTLSNQKVVSYDTLPSFQGIDFGKGFIKDKKAGYIYAFGCKLAQLKGEVFVARIPLGNPNGYWEFWNGKKWSQEVDEAVKITESASNSIHVSFVNGKYLLLSSEFSVGCDQGKRIFASVSDFPTGPFSKKKTIYTIDDTLQGHYPFFYFPIAHPAYINDHNELLITYSINGYSDCINICKEGHQNPNFYRPKAFRVSIPYLFDE